MNETNTRPSETPKPPAAPAPDRERRKNVPGAFAKHNGHRADRSVRRIGKELRALAAFRGRLGLRFASRDKVKKILDRISARRMVTLAREMTRVQTRRTA